MGRQTLSLTRIGASRMIAVVILAAVALAIWGSVKPAYALGGEVPIGHETASSRPAIAYCGSYAYMAWIGTDSHHSLNFGWPLPSSNSDFANKIYMNSTTTSMEDPNGGVEDGPALACYNNNLYVAYVGANTHIYVGYFTLPGNSGDRYLHQETDTGEATVSSLALANHSGDLFLAFRGSTNTNLYFKGSPNGSTWATGASGVVYFDISSEQTSAGLGLAE